MVLKLKSHLSVVNLNCYYMDEATVKIVLNTVFVSPRNALFGNKRFETVSDVINY